MKVDEFLNNVQAGDKPSLQLASKVTKAYLLRYLGKREAHSATFPGVSLLLWRQGADSRFTQEAAVRYAMQQTMPFRHAQHAANAYRKLCRVVEEICHDRPDDLVMWAMWITCVACRSRAAERAKNTTTRS